MINEELARKTLNMEIDATKKVSKVLFNELKKLLSKSKKYGGLENYVKKQGSEIKLKNLVKKGQLEEYTVTDRELKELKKELNKHGVSFSVMKDKQSGNYSVFFQAKDIKVMEKAFQNTLAKIGKKEVAKDSVRKNINKFKEVIKNTVTKDKVKNKQKEQSL